MNAQKKPVPMQDEAGDGHLLELQSFRGLAALLVVVHHCLFYYEYPTFYKDAVETALNAHGAVVAFYVLSGLVLCLSLARRGLSKVNVLRFYVRRGFRIFPALCVACILGFAYLLAFRSSPIPENVSTWWPESYRDSVISPKGVVLAFLGFGYELPVAIWSITAELIGSFLMPLIVYFLLKRRAWYFLFLAALGIFAFKSRFAIPSYAIHFAFGALILIMAPKLKIFFSRQPALVVAVAAAGFLLLNFGRQLGPWRYDAYYHAALPALIEGVAATILISAIFSCPQSFSFLRAPALVALGDISFSLYLLHLPIMAWVAAIGGEILNLGPFNSNSAAVRSMALLVCTICISVPLSILSYKFVELPGIKVGAFLFRKLQVFGMSRG